MMQKRLVDIPFMKILMIILVFFILLLIIIITMSFTVEVADGESGGTDAWITVNATAGDQGFQWNETHGFELLENGSSVTEPMNITLCDHVKWSPSDDRYKPSGYIYGDLNAIHYDDDPEPFIRISEEDFENWKESEKNLTLAVLGEYARPKGNETELRQAYIELTITENEKPMAAAMVTEQQEGENANWTGWKGMPHESTITYIVPHDNSAIRLYFNASPSYDPDGIITEFLWDLDEDGNFGSDGETGENLSRYLTIGKVYQFGLEVSDGKQLSDPLLFTIQIFAPQVSPDLTIDNFSIRNLNNMDHFRKYDWIELDITITNDGLNSTGGGDFTSTLDIKFENDSEYNTLWDWESIENIKPGSQVHRSFFWDTTLDDYPAGYYSFRIHVDALGNITESDESNNMYEVHDIFLEPDTIPEDPAIYIQNIDVSKTEVVLNEQVIINVTIINVGTGHAKYVELNYYVNNVYQYFLTFDKIAREGGSRSASFVFSPVHKGEYDISFSTMDDGLETDRSDYIPIIVLKPEQSPNLSLMKISPSKEVILSEEEFEIHVIVENNGDATARFVDVHMLLDYAGYEIMDEVFIESIEPGKNVTVTFRVSLTWGGEYYAVFNITDNQIEKDSDFIVIKIWNRPPYDPFIGTIIFIPNPVHSGELVRLGAYVSSYPSKIISYAWHSSLIGEFYNGLNPVLLMRFNRTGTHTLTLTVTDDNGVTVQKSDTLIVLPADDEPPSVQVTSVERYLSNSSIFLIKGVATDNELVLSVEYRILGEEEWHQADGTTKWTVELVLNNSVGNTVVLEIRSWDSTNHSEVVKEIIDTRDTGYEEEEGSGLSLSIVLLFLVGLGALVLLSRKYA